jgi:LacI family transcriptional regulator
VARKVTLADVARAAGVSLATIDRVLNGRGGVDRKKEASVLHWARRLRLDRNLDVRPTRLLRVGVLMSETSNPFYRSLQDAVARANWLFQANSIRCFVHHIDVLAPARSAARIDAAAASHDAMIVVCPEEPLIAAAFARTASAVPVVTLASDLPGSGWLAYVGLDNRTAGRTASELMGKFLGPGGGEVVVVSGACTAISGTRNAREASAPSWRSASRRAGSWPSWKRASEPRGPGPLWRNSSG